jgi:hypothetical protein
MYRILKVNGVRPKLTIFKVANQISRIITDYKVSGIGTLMNKLPVVLRSAADYFSITWRTLTYTAVMLAVLSIGVFYS